MKIKETFWEKQLKKLNNSPETVKFLEGYVPQGIEEQVSVTGERNIIKRRPDGTTYMLHSPYSPIKEAEQMISQLPLQENSVLYIFGLGFAYCYEYLEKWLSQSSHHFIHFFEPDPDVIIAFLSSPRAEKVLSHNKVGIHIIPADPEEMRLMIERISWTRLFLFPSHAILPSYHRELPKESMSLMKEVYHIARRINSLGREFTKADSAFFQNFYENLPFLVESYHAQRLAGTFKEVPAIICGAGPSLEKQFGALKELHEKALIFAGGSSLKILTHHHVFPHFGGAIDPNSPQMDRLSTHSGYHIPIFYRLRLFKECLEKIHGPRIYVNGSGTYPIGGWVENELGMRQEVEAELDEGYNVIFFLTEIARYMGCNPIIFVGLDMAYSGDNHYAPGILTSGEKSPISEAIQRPDIYGNTTSTSWIWINESQQMARHAQENPKTLFINATEGGIGFSGIENCRLSEVTSRYLSQMSNLSGRVHAALMNAQLDITSNDLLKVVEKLNLSISRCDELAMEMIRLIPFLEEKAKETKGQTDVFQFLEAQKVEIGLKNEPAFMYAFKVMMLVQGYLIRRQADSFFGDPDLNPVEKLTKLIKLNRERGNFLSTAAHMHKEMITQTLLKIEANKSVEELSVCS